VFKVKFKAAVEHRFFRPAIGAAVATLCGLALWGMPIGEPWENASYDYLFRFGAREATNKLVLVLMDRSSLEALGQKRENWDRGLHAEFLKKLTADRCPLVVFDILFDTKREPETDKKLADAMQQLGGHGQVVLMAEVTNPKHPLMDDARVLAPDELFLNAATNWGVGQVDALTSATPRRRYEYPSTENGEIRSLPWVAAELAGARLNPKSEEQWLRYYANSVRWPMSYDLALSNSPGYFRDKVVFIGSKPERKDPDFPEEDKFRTPFTSQTGEAVGGVEILATTFLNLMNHDWLRRADRRLEMLFLCATGILLGSGLCRVRLPVAFGLAAGAGLATALGAISLSYYTNFWFPWLVIAGGQVPCALGWTLAMPRSSRTNDRTETRENKPADKNTIVISPDAFEPEVPLPETPGYELVEPPIGKGNFGKVWLAHTVTGEYKALKVIYRKECEKNRVPYETEFEGIKKYKPVSNEDPGLLHIEHVARNDTAGYFYYVMELGDALAPDWDGTPTTYKPRDLEHERMAAGGMLPVLQCVRIGVALAEALDFLHRQQLTHRDIKPRNIIFVKGRPKLADVGLVTEIRSTCEIRTYAGTPDYMPPSPEPPGTKQADIYGLGMVLYVISTGRKPDIFLEPPTTLVKSPGHEDFIVIQAILLRACHLDRTHRYKTAAELHQALVEAQQTLERAQTLRDS
jgi:CHASE2 domain-containing sensor protein